MTTKYETSTVDNDSDGFFERHRGMLRCVLCRTMLPGDSSADDLTQHISEKHCHSDDSQNSDNDIDKELEDETFTEVVYLEDEKPLKTIKKRISDTLKPSPRAFSRKRPKTIKRRNSSSSDEVLAKTKKVDDEEIDKFCNYIKCLLKTVPKDISNKLQMDIVSLIMSAKLNMQDKTENSVAVSQAISAPGTSDSSTNSIGKLSAIDIPVTVSNNISNE